MSNPATQRSSIVMSGVFCLRLMAFLLALALTLPSALGANVRAAFSRDVTVPSEPVRLEIRVEGGRPSAPPRDIQADGINVSYIGSSQSNQITFANGRMRTVTEVIYNYSVTPDRVGTFTIPAVEVEVDGQILRTQPIALRVEDNPGGGGAAGGAAPIARVGFAEIIPSKKTAYIGETIPTEVRLYVDSRIRWQPEAMPTLEGEGFTKAKMPEPEQKREQRDGRDYDVLVFRTAITPSRAGTLKVGPTELPFQASIPRAQPNRRRSQGGFFGEDFFNDPFFGGFGAVERRVAKAEVVELEVKPLPVAGRPASFSGAVGDFSLTSDGNPNSVKVGDPLTMNISISGRGNFDRMGAPVLADGTGWRTYPPSSNFQPEDDVGFRGTKTFQVAVIPETKKTQMPQFEFSYFDPRQEKYVTKMTEPAPLTVQGTAQPPPSPVPRRAVPAEAATPPPPTPEADKNAPMTDILGLRYDVGSSRSFTPIYEKRGFWLAQLIPLAVLLGLFAARFMRSNADARKLAVLRRERSANLTRLQREKGRAEFFDAAVRTIQYDTALATGQAPGAVDAFAACHSRNLDPATTEAVQRIFDSRAELLYAGNGQASEPVSVPERDQVLATVAQFEKHPASARV